LIPQSAGQHFLSGRKKEKIMKAVIYNGPYDVKVKDVPDAKIVRPTDVLVHHHHQHLWVGLAHV
jgi:hypothetical protein